MFVCILTSRANVTELRAAHRTAHDEYWDTRMGALKFAGPLLTDDGATRLGQIMVVEAADKAAAEDIVLNDPFVKAGVYDSHETYRFSVSVNAG
jgi:uncharacterized protein YciI